MRAVNVVLTATGNSAPVVLDQYISPFNITLALVVSGTNTTTVQFTADNPAAVYVTNYNTNATWFNHPDMNSMTVNEIGNIAFPVRAVRLNCSAYTSGSATLTILQAGIKA
jgi:hypothetical protein